VTTGKQDETEIKSEDKIAAIIKFAPTNSQKVFVGPKRADRLGVTIVKKVNRQKKIGARAMRPRERLAPSLESGIGTAQMGLNPKEQHDLCKETGRMLRFGHVPIGRSWRAAIRRAITVLN
jgi:hypothetical protein